MERYIQPWAVNFNGSKLNCADSTGVTVTFKDADGNNTRAKRVSIRFGAAAGHIGKIHRVFYNRHGTMADADASNMFNYAGEVELVIPFMCAQVKIFAIDPGAMAYGVYIDAFSDEDITGTTIA